MSDSSGLPRARTAKCCVCAIVRAHARNSARVGTRAGGSEAPQSTKNRTRFHTANRLRALEATFPLGGCVVLVPRCTAVPAIARTRGYVRARK